MARKAPISLPERLDIAGSLLQRSDVFLESWRLSAMVDGREEYQAFWEEHWEFWRFAEHAFLFSFIVQAAALFEARSDTVNLRQLWSEISSIDNLQGVLSDINLSLKPVEHVARGIVIIRSNAMAHRSASLSYKEAFSQAQITPNDLRALLNTSLTLLNEMRSALKLEEIEFRKLAVDELRRLISASEAHRQNVA